MKRSLWVIAALTLVAFHSAAAEPEISPSPFNWSMEDANPQHSRSVAVTVQPPLVRFWQKGPSAGAYGNVQDQLLPAAADSARVYCSSIRDRRYWLVALDAGTGEERWSVPFGAAGREPGPLKPVVAGGRVFLRLETTAGQWGLFSVDAASGAPVWETGPVTRQSLAAREAPEIVPEDLCLDHNTLVFCRPGDPPLTPVGLIAYRASDGHLLWQVPKVDARGLCILHDTVAVGGTGGEESPTVTLYRLDTGARVRQYASIMTYRLHPDETASWSLVSVDPELDLFAYSWGRFFGGKDYPVDREEPETLLDGPVGYQARVRWTLRNGQWLEGPAFLSAVEFMTRRLLWTIPEALRPNAVSGAVLWATTGDGRLVAIATRTGHILWRSPRNHYQQIIIGPRGIYAQRYPVDPNLHPRTARYTIEALSPAATKSGPG